MERFILKLKHWQLFTATTVLPMLGVLIIMGWMMSSVLSTDNATPEEIHPRIFGMFLYTIPFSVIGVFFQLGWLWAVVKGLQHKIPDGIDLHIKRFDIIFVAVIILLLLMYAFMYLIFTTFFATFPIPSASPEYFVLFFLVFPVNMALLGCLLYLMFFAAQTLKTVELQHRSGINKCALEFVLFWFPIVGIWILQPRINKLIEE